MATGSYLNPIYSRSQSEVQGDLHKMKRNLEPEIWPRSVAKEETGNKRRRVTTSTHPPRDIVTCIDRNPITVMQKWNEWVHKGPTEFHSGSQEPPTVQA
ncbi:hypothetical protein TNCV_3186511 [Trichonephila clavipes]|nr:hypothetical protein TNCV_3186511 [Trichonephila clavipes]